MQSDHAFATTETSSEQLSAAYKCNLPVAAAGSSSLYAAQQRYLSLSIDMSILICRESVQVPRRLPHGGGCPHLQVPALHNHGKTMLIYN